MKKIIALMIAVCLAALCAPAVSAEEHGYTDLGLTDGELILVAKALAAETSGRNYLTKTCVAAMLFNRMKDEVLHRSAQDAVYEQGAFLFTDKTSIDEVDTESKAFEEYRYLVRLVYEYGIDPTCGALFCFEEGDTDAEDFTVTIKTDGLIFAAP